MGGAFYVSESILSLQNQILINSNSTYYAGCLFGKNVEAYLKNISVENHFHGCIYFLNSSIIIENSAFSNTFQETPESSLCYSTICLLYCSSFNIKTCSISGNINNTYHGGVTKIKKNYKINFILFRQFLYQTEKNRLIILPLKTPFLLKIVPFSMEEQFSWRMF